MAAYVNWKTLHNNPASENNMSIIHRRLYNFTWSLLTAAIDMNRFVKWDVTKNEYFNYAMVSNPILSHQALLAPLDSVHLPNVVLICSLQTPFLLL